MILQNDLACIIDGRFHCGKLDQNLAAVPAVLHHALDGFQMPDCPGKAVQYSLGLCMTVMMSVFSMGMGDCGPIIQNMGVNMRFPIFMGMVWGIFLDHVILL